MTNSRNENGWVKVCNQRAPSDPGPIGPLVVRYRKYFIVNKMAYPINSKLIVCAVKFQNGIRGCVILVKISKIDSMCS